MFICCHVYLYLCILGSEFIIHVIYTFYIITINIAYQDVNNIYIYIRKMQFYQETLCGEGDKIVNQATHSSTQTSPPKPSLRLKWTGMN